MDYRKLLTEMWGTLDQDRRLDQMDRFYAEGYRRHSDEGTLDRDEFADSLGRLHEGFPDLEFEIHDVVAEGRQVAYRWSFVGTHQSDYLGAPATGKKIQARGITISTFDDEGLIEEDWASWNRSSVLHSLGIIPLE